MTVDVFGVVFVDSTGLMALVTIENECAKRATALSIVNAPPRLTGLVALAGLDGVLPITSNDGDIH